MPYTNSTNIPTQQNQSRSTKPIWILHVVGGMDRGGAETWLMHILRNIDCDRFQMDFLAPADQHDVRAEFGIPTDAFFIGHVGRFESQENHHFLLEIAAEVALP